MTRPVTQREMNAVDALEKIKAILNAALFLTSSRHEKDAQTELIGIAEDVATRVLEDRQ
ncbi:hypothetical protein OMR58_16215 [Erwinia sp. INIA-01]|uniref:hypothetical protein n=1 Tax=Erwiniaceae TaxID=1903409 RepID=UPI0019621291|nr:MULTISPECIES: hypothetical protein [Erwiniaceae]MBM7342729.1 hypothetical protein [Pantoea coffeiphila]MCW1875998.1 hypothetical protein [Erwinia sp. INIA01]